jgi:predicted dehydrogenase
LKKAEEMESMNLTPEMKDQGRRNFLKALAGTPALLALGAAAASRGPVRGGPVKAALIGPGGQGKVLLGQCRKEYIDIKALCDINPKHNEQAADGLVKAGFQKPNLYDDWRQMLEKEDLEAVIVATPLWTHADITVGCLDAGKHVLCEKMMAWDVASCKRMLEASRKNKRVLEIGYQRFYNPVYQAAYEGVVRNGLLGDIYHARLAWHRNASWRREEQPPSSDYDPSKWGYPTWEHLLNWRMYKKYSGGLMAELGSHQVAVTNWFFDSAPEAVHASGGISQYKDGREVFDHVFVTYDYPQGRTVTFSSIQSNKFDNNYEQIMGTRGTLFMLGERDALLFSEQDEKSTNIEVSKQTGNAIIDASESRSADAAGRTVERRSETNVDRLTAYGNQISEFCSAVRTGSPLRCGPEKALNSAMSCLAANEAIEKKVRLPITPLNGDSV